MVENPSSLSERLIDAPRGRQRNPELVSHAVALNRPNNLGIPYAIRLSDSLLERNTTAALITAAITWESGFRVIF